MVNYMIDKYEIKIINGQEVLLLYIDINTEFGGIKNIKEFINKNKITFKGSLVIIMVGTTFLGKIYLNKQDPELYKYNNQVAINEIVKNKEYIKEPNVISITDDKVINKEDILESITETPIIEEKNNSNNDELLIKNENFTKTTIDLAEQLDYETSKDINIYVTLNRNNGNIINIELEEYVVGVVSAEMPALFSIEALKSQAIIARTYALKSIANNKLLTDTSSTQNYKDITELQNIWGSNFNTYYNRIKSAVDSTKGEYLSYNGTYIEAVYHSTSNGMTESSENVWGNSFPYLVSVDSPYDETNPSFIKDKFITYEELSRLLKTEISQDTEILATERSSSNRIIKLKINNITFSGTDIRNILGLRSTDFEIIKEENGIIFRMKGYGHGVGMSQYGANGYAKNGYNAYQILEHYYPGTIVNHL